METITAYTPVQLLAQLNQLPAQAKDHDSNRQPADSIINLVRRAHDLPSPLQKALSFTIKTSQLGTLLDLVADASDPDLQATAFKMIQFRLKSRLAGPVWHYFQTEPGRFEYAELLLNYARENREGHHRTVHREDIQLAFVGMIGQATLTNTCRAEQLEKILIQHLTQFELTQMTCAQLMKRYDLDLPGQFAEDLLIEYFSLCSEPVFQQNLVMLIHLLDVSTEDARLWPVINRYFEQIRPLQLDDGIGRRVDVRLGSERNRTGTQVPSVSADRPLEVKAAPSADPLTALARKRFKYWQILYSLRCSILQPRLVDLLSRYYYLLDHEAESVPQTGVLIKMGQLVLVVRENDDHFYLYPRNVFDQTEVSWKLAQRPGKNSTADQSVDSISDPGDTNEGLTDLDENPIITIENLNVTNENQDDTSADQAEKYDVQDTGSSPWPMSQPNPWPIDQQIVMPARQALLNEQDKRPDERSLVDLLVRNEIMSIIQLSLVDAHYLFARKIFDELSAFKGAVPD